MVASFPDILAGGSLAAIRAGEYSATPYLLYNPENIVFQAQVNQATFGKKFATVTFDNVATGVIADALSGFTVYIGPTAGDIKDARKNGFVGRCRAGSAGAILNINENSEVITDDWYIMVVKDVAIRQILGLYENKVMKVDWDIAYRPPLPRVTELDSCYVGVLAAGQVDFTFPAVGLPTTSGAAISSWLWDADGGAFVNGTIATDAQPDIRYTVAGVYWPRVTVTDDNGLTNWFTMPVFVASPDLSDDFIVTGLEALSISSQMASGQEMRFNYFSDELDDVVQQTFVALWCVDDYNGSSTPILNQIAFVGRMRKEDPKTPVDAESGPLPETTFVCEGILAQMLRLRAPQTALRFDATPTVFQEINNMTQWRAASFIITEFSTVANVCSLSFDVEDNTYLNREDQTDNTNLLAGINGLLAARKGALNQSSTGQLYGARNANFMTTAQRNALDTITTITNNDTFADTISIDQANAIGQITGYAGAYNSVDETLRTLRASAPAIASNAGQGIGSPINGILLASNSTLTAKKIEIEQIVADGLADANPKDIVKEEILDGYWFLMPTNFQWYGKLMAATENNRGIVYDGTDRFLLTGMNIAFDNALSSWNVTPTLSHETKGGAAQTISQVQPDAIPPALPGIPSLPAYPSFPPLPSFWIPDGSIIIPPISEGDANIVNNPVEPFAQVEAKSLKGEVGMWWDATEFYIALDVASNVNPTWESKFTVTAPKAIQDAKFDPFDLGAWVLTNDGAGNSKLWYTANVFESIPTWTESTTTLDDIDYTTIRTTSTPGRVYIFGIDDRVPPATVTLLNGSGNAGLSPSGLSAPHGGSSNAPGIYSSGNDWYYGPEGDLGGLCANVEYNLPARAVLDKVVYVAKGQRVGAVSGERACQVSLDGISIGGTNSFGAGGAAQILTIPKGPGLALTGSTMLFHVSIDTKSTSYARLTSIVLTLTDSGNAQTACRLSDDYGDTLGNLLAMGTTFSGGDDDPGYDSGAADDFAYCAADAIIRESDDQAAPADKTDSDSAATFTKAIWAYGKNAQADIVFATDAAFGGITMAKIVNDVASDITPDDGVDDGLIISRNALCMSRVSDVHIWCICTYNVTVKFAYTIDGGTGWTVSALVLTTGAIYIRVKNTDTKQVYIMDSNVIKYSEDGGANFLTDRTAPGIAGLGFEVR